MKVSFGSIFDYYFYLALFLNLKFWESMLILPNINFYFSML